MMDGFAKRGLLKKLQQIESDSLTMSTPGASHEFGVAGGLSAHIDVLEPAFFSEIAFGGSIGAAESYIHGAWRCDDLVNLVRILLRNRDVLEGMDGGAARISAPIRRFAHWINRNTRAGARRNISAHYDLGNDFFALWLDETMMYSSAMFARDDMSLHEAQLYRLGRICQKLDLNADDHVIEIGTGWGGFAVYAAEHFGCRVTTTTISEEQYKLSRERVARAGLEDKVTVLQDDFRDLEGHYDKLVSIEMIEAIDAGLYVPFFKKCSQLLRPDGLALIQAITMMDQRYDEYRRSIDFIRKYIFPGSGLPSSAIMTSVMADETDFRVLDIEDIGLDYARTLQCWRNNFLARLDEIRSLGYTESFLRMWEYYLCYCEGAFRERAISDLHLVMAKPENRTVIR